jgi:hypothetical protein
MRRKIEDNETNPGVSARRGFDVDPVAEMAARSSGVTAGY